MRSWRVRSRYLKYYCKSSLSWGENGTGDHIDIPSPLPRVSSTWTQEVCLREGCDSRFAPSTVTT